MSQSYYNLSEKILIANPNMVYNNMYDKSVIYVISHTMDHIIGLVVNYITHYTYISTLIDDFYYQNNTNISEYHADYDTLVAVHLGGKKESKKGLFLHSTDYTKNILLASKKHNIAISSNLEIIEDIANGVGPQKKLFIAGYTYWTTQELEFELNNNLWIISEFQEEIIFTENTIKWINALRTLGLTSYQYFNPLVYC